MSKIETITVIYTLTYAKPPFNDINKYLSQLANFNNNNNINSIIINQTGYPFEINAKIKNKIKIKIFELKNIHPLSVCRNKGVDSLNDDGFVLFGDEDVSYNEDILKLLDFKCIDILYGNIMNIYTNQLLLTNRFKDIRKNILLTIKSASVAYSKNFLKSNKFNEEFGVGSYYHSGEETDLLIKAFYNGFKIRHVNFIISYTSIIDWDEINPVKIANYSFGFGALLKKNLNKLGLRVIFTSLLHSLFVSVKYLFINKTIARNSAIYFLNSLKGFNAYKVKK